MLVDCELFIALLLIESKLCCGGKCGRVKNGANIGKNGGQARFLGGDANWAANASCNAGCKFEPPDIFDNRFWWCPKTIIKSNKLV